MTRNKLSLLPLLLLLLVLPALICACNKKDDGDDDDQAYIEPTDVGIFAFSLSKNAKILSGLDSVYFSIDLEKAIVFNADSLPKGTDVTKLVPRITYSQYITSAVIEMTGGKLREGTTNYIKQPGDSIDFTGRVTLTLTSSKGNSRKYELKVNVHESDPDSLCWGNTSFSRLPSRLPSPKAQRTLMRGQEVLTLLLESDDSYTLSTTADPAQGSWTQTKVTLPPSPQVRSLMASEHTLYILDSYGTLYSSPDGSAWTSVSSGWLSLIGVYGTDLLGVKNDSNTARIVSLSGANPDVFLTGDMADFPIQDASNLLLYQSKWMGAPTALIAGGVTQYGEVSSAVWGYDGNNWAQLSRGKIPALRCPTLVPYFAFVRNTGKWVYTEYATVMLLCGLDDQAQANREVYLSYDNGVNFSKGPSLLQMPEAIPGMWQTDGIVSAVDRKESLLPDGWQPSASAPLPVWLQRAPAVVEGTDVSWECPYIYLFGGTDAPGTLYDTIWRGVINRLTFTPIV